MELAGRPAKRALAIVKSGQNKSLKQGVVLHVPERKGLIFLILYKANMQDQGSFSNVV